MLRIATDRVNLFRSLHERGASTDVQSRIFTCSAGSKLLTLSSMP